MDFELCVIGTALDDPATMIEAEDLLPSDFSGFRKDVWETMLTLNRKGILTPAALEASLTTSDTGRLINDALMAKGGNMAELARMVIDASIRRALKRSAALIATTAQDENVPMEEVMDYAEKQILALRRDKKDGVSLGDMLAILIPRTMDARAGTFVPAWTPKLTAVRLIVPSVEDTDLVVIGGRPGDGKCLARGTQVVMSNGTRKAVEDVRVGDLLMGPNSKPRRVLSTTQGRAMMYWVRQNRAVDYRVNENHILSLKRSKNEGSKTHGEIINISVHDLLCKSKSFLNRWKGYKVGIDLPETPVSLEPYFLGLWLGDGTTNTPVITKPDQEVIDYLQDYANRRRDNLHSHKMSHAITRKSGYKQGETIRGLLNGLGVLDHKHIPDFYLRNSRRIRMELLAGLIDSDGSKAQR